MYSSLPSSKLTPVPELFSTDNGGEPNSVGPLTLRGSDDDPGHDITVTGGRLDPVDAQALRGSAFEGAPTIHGGRGLNFMPVLTLRGGGGSDRRNTRGRSRSPLTHRGQYPAARSNDRDRYYDNRSSYHDDFGRRHSDRDRYPAAQHRQPDSYRATEREDYDEGYRRNDRDRRHADDSYHGPRGTTARALESITGCHHEPHYSMPIRADRLGITTMADVVSIRENGLLNPARRSPSEEVRNPQSRNSCHPVLRRQRKLNMTHAAEPEKRRISEGVRHTCSSRPR